MMTRLKLAAIASAVGLMVMTVPVDAQPTRHDRQGCVGPDCADRSDGEDNQRSMRNRGGHDDQTPRKLRNRAGDDDRTDRQRRNRAAKDDDNRKRRARADVDDRDDRRRVDRNRHANWRFDPRRHYRRKFRDARFRFYLDGYWYAEPYWLVYVPDVYDRVSCREGRNILERRYNRVRAVECNGRIYTYTGRRNGESYRISLNAETGRIVRSRQI